MRFSSKETISLSLRDMFTEVLHWRRELLTLQFCNFLCCTTSVHLSRCFWGKHDCSRNNSVEIMFWDYCWRHKVLHFLLFGSQGCLKIHRVPNKSILLFAVQIFSSRDSAEIHPVCTQREALRPGDGVQPADPETVVGAVRQGNCRGAERYLYNGGQGKR